MSATPMIYDAFISYSHAADEKLAPALQFALHRFARPWYKRRALRIFRDTTNLSISPGLWPSIERALGDSKYFILMASRESAVSKWVQKEVEFWLKHRPSNNLLIVLTDGGIAWDNAIGDFDWPKSDALPPSMAKAFTDEPLYLDLRWIRTDKIQDLSLNNATFRDKIADLAATMHGRSKDDIVGEDIEQHRKTKRLAWSLGIALFLLTAIAFVAAGVAGLQWISAKEQLATNYWSQAVSAEKGDDRLRAAHFSAKAGQELGPVLTYVSFISKFRIRQQKATEVHSQIRASLLNVHLDSQEMLLGHVLQHGGAIAGVRFSQDEQRILTRSWDGTARLWQAKDGALVGQPMKHDKAVSGATLSKDEQRILTWSWDGTVRLWNIEADYDFPTEHIPLLVEILTGTTMDDFGNIHTLDSQGWNERRGKYIKLAEKHLQACEFEIVNLYKAQKQFWGVEKKEATGPGHYTVATVSTALPR